MYGTIRLHQERYHPRSVSGTDLVNPDVAAYALEARARHRPAADGAATA
jgi:thiamine pyrophosphate-dependent acetolactate synthase large subunit-like protein